MIIDTDIDVTAKLPELKAAGVTAIGRYLNRVDPHEAKVIKPLEAKAFFAIGMQLFLIFEIGGKPSGAAQGKLDGEWCRLYVPTLGMPSGSAIYNTVDYDAPSTDISGILAYFRAFQLAIGSYQCGGYGSGYVLGWLSNSKVITMRWLAESRGFTGTKNAVANGNYDLLQSISPALDGVDVDTNVTRVPGFDFGARVPFAAQAPVTKPVVAAKPDESFFARLREIFAG